MKNIFEKLEIIFYILVIFFLSYLIIIFVSFLFDVSEKQCLGYGEYKNITVRYKKDFIGTHTCYKRESFSNIDTLSSIDSSFRDYEKYKELNNLTDDYFIK